jgi:hypothetical protein
VTGRLFSLGPQVSSTNKTDCHNITEILLKVALNTIKQNKQQNCKVWDNDIYIIVYFCIILLLHIPSKGIRLSADRDFKQAWKSKSSKGLCKKLSLPEIL